MVEDPFVARKDGAQLPLVADMGPGRLLGRVPASRGARAGLAGSADEGGKGPGRGVSCEVRRNVVNADYYSPSLQIIFTQGLGEGAATPRPGDGGLEEGAARPAFLTYHHRRRPVSGLESPKPRSPALRGPLRSCARLYVALFRSFLLTCPCVPA